MIWVNFPVTALKSVEYINNAFMRSIVHISLGATYLWVYIFGHKFSSIFNVVWRPSYREILPFPQKTEHWPEN